VKALPIKTLKGAVVLLLIGMLFNVKLIIYGVEQLSGQMNIIRHSVPVELALRDESLTDSVKNKLRLIEEIRTFAFDSLGLKRNNNYTTFYNQQGKPVLWNVTGSEPFRLHAYHWWFPFLGKVSYKGFFNQDKAEKEWLRLKGMGYDADVSPVSGWSTLGWFSDPVLSNMLRRREGSLAELIIHELTHGTIYLKSSVDLNENLATFVGEQGAVLFLKSKYGESSPQLTQYLHYKSDEETYGKHILNGAMKLDSLYAQPAFQNLVLKEKLRRKYDLIASVLLDVDRLPLHNKKVYLHDFRSEPLPDNTYFMSYLRYRKKQDVFSEQLRNECQGSLKHFILKMKDGE
jgi:predicted aminopeptidase